MIQIASMDAPPLIEHEALQCVLPNATRYIEKGFAAYQSGVVKFEALCAEQLASSILGRVAELDESIASLQMASKFVQDVCDGDQPDATVYRYHYENFVFRGIGVVDRAYLLVADALQMTKSARSQRKRIIERMSEHPEVASEVDAVVQVMSPHRDARNRVAHESAYSDSTLGALIALRQVGLDKDGSARREPAQEYFCAGKLEITIAVDQLVTALSRLLTALRPHFEAGMAGS